MPTSFSEAPAAVRDLAVGLIEAHYQDLKEGDVTITYLMAHNPDGPALTKGGWPCKALVKINSLRDRVAGLSDCLILLDEDGWREWSAKHQLAVMDHELFHVLVCRNKVGAIKYDDANRPKLKLRPHDFECTGFHAIARRHGAHSVEVQGIEGVSKVWLQREFDFGDAFLETGSVVK